MESFRSTVSIELILDPSKMEFNKKNYKNVPKVIQQTITWGMGGIHTKKSLPQIGFGKAMFLLSWEWLVLSSNANTAKVYVISWAEFR